MAKYFFHIRSPEMFFEDREGDEFATDDEALLHAQQTIRELVSRALLGNETVPWRSVVEVWIEDAEVFKVTFIEAVGLDLSS